MTTYFTKHRYVLLLLFFVLSSCGESQESSIDTLETDEITLNNFLEIRTGVDLIIGEINQVETTADGLKLLVDTQQKKYTCLMLMETTSVLKWARVMDRGK